VHGRRPKQAPLPPQLLGCARSGHGLWLAMVRGRRGRAATHILPQLASASVADCRDPTPPAELRTGRRRHQRAERVRGPGTCAAVLRRRCAADARCRRSGCDAFCALCWQADRSRGRALTSSGPRVSNQTPVSRCAPPPRPRNDLREGSARAGHLHLLLLNSRKSRISAARSAIPCHLPDQHSIHTAITTVVTFRRRSDTHGTPFCSRVARHLPGGGTCSLASPQKTRPPVAELPRWTRHDQWAKLQGGFRISRARRRAVRADWSLPEAEAPQEVQFSSVRFEDFPENLLNLAQ
jgi:hypothetical protein